MFSKLIAVVLTLSVMVCPMMAKAKKNVKPVYQGKGQRVPDSRRITEMHNALERAGYPGEWKAAMRQFQADHGWQVKFVPDSRALIELGLGPSHLNLLNPHTAWVQGDHTPVGQ